MNRREEASYSDCRAGAGEHAGSRCGGSGGPCQRQFSRNSNQFDSYQDEIDTTEATRDTNDPSECVGSFRTVWYQYTATASTRLLASARFEASGAAIGVFTGGPKNFTRVACSLNYPMGASARAVFVAEPGATYYFFVSNYYGSGCSLTLLSRFHHPDAKLRLDY